jgi:hypothetical protein
LSIGGAAVEDKSEFSVFLSDSEDSDCSLPLSASSVELSLFYTSDEPKTEQRAAIEEQWVCVSTHVSDAFAEIAVENRAILVEEIRSVLGAD